MVCHEGLVSKENNYCRNLETVSRDGITSENPAFIKRKRGRPRKICSDAKTFPNANISNHSTGSAAGNGDLGYFCNSKTLDIFNFMPNLCFQILRHKLIYSDH